jgi:ribosomal protein S27E
MILHMNHNTTADLFAGLTISMMVMPFMYWLVCAVVASAVASSKNRSGAGYFFAALFFLGPLAIAVAMLVAPGEPRVPLLPLADTRLASQSKSALVNKRPASQPKSAPAEERSESTKVRCYHCQHVQAVPLSQSRFVCEQCDTTLKRRTTPAKSNLRAERPLSRSSTSSCVGRPRWLRARRATDQSAPCWVCSHSSRELRGDAGPRPIAIILGGIEGAQ